MSPHPVGSGSQESAALRLCARLVHSLVPVGPRFTGASISASTSHAVRLEDPPPPPKNCSSLQVVSGGTSLARYNAGRPQTGLRDPRNRPRRARFEMRSPVGPVARLLRPTPSMTWQRSSQSITAGFVRLRAATPTRSGRDIWIGGVHRIKQRYTFSGIHFPHLAMLRTNPTRPHASRPTGTATTSHSAHATGVIDEPTFACSNQVPAVNYITAY